MTVSGTRMRPAFLLALLLAATAAAAEPDTKLLTAAQQGDREAVRTLLRQGSSVNAQDVDGTTLLHWAVRNNDAETVKLLLGRRADVKAANRYGVTALSLAAVNGSAPIVGLLLAAGADSNSALPEGETVLMTAARTGNLAVVRALLAAGAEVNRAEGWQGQTAVMWAAAEDHGDVVAALIKAGADLNIRSKVLPGMPQRPRGGDVAQQGVHSNFPKGGLTALHFAVRQNAVAAVSAMAEGGVNLDQQDPDGFTPFILAALNGNYDLARLLIERGAGLEAADKGGRTPLFAAVDMHTYEYSYNRPAPKPSGEMDSVDLVRFLLARGANPNARLTSRVIPAKYDTAGNPNLTAGSTPFLKAASTADVTLMRILLEAGADPFITNLTRTNAMMMAAGLNWRNPGSLGSEKDAIEAIRICIEQGLDIEAYNDLGQTALHAATMRGRGSSGENNEGPNTAESEQLVRFLVAKGAPLDAQDKSGRTPVAMAQFMKNPTIATLLGELGGAQQARAGQR